MDSRTKFSVLLVVLFWSGTSFANVSVTVNGDHYQYGSNPRLSTVLKQVANQNDWYWPASALYRRKSEEVELERTKILAELSVLIAEADGNSKTLLTALYDQIDNWRLSKRVHLKIDYDLARIREEFNPRFEDGTYDLYLSTRPQSVHVIGMVNNIDILPHQDTNSIQSYFKDLSTSEKADSDHVYVIHNDGKLEKLVHSYWDKKHIEVSPGAQLFIPLPEIFLFDNNSDLNERIAKLAVNRLL